MASLTFAVGRPTPLVGYPVSRRVVSLGRGRAAVCPPRRAGDADFIIETGDAPGEGKRTRPGPSADAASERASLEAPKGPQVNSAGVAPDEVAPLEDAFAKLSEYPFSEWPRASDAPGEGKRHAPGVAEFPENKGKPALEPPRGPVPGKSNGGD